jgi:photosynthetic reaction center cytochrome c subunit
MKTILSVLSVFGAIFAIVLTLGVLTAGWERPWPKVTQIGYRGVQMQQLDNRARLKATLAANVAPDAQDPAAPGGKLASEVYKNVKVLGGLTENQFNRVMLSITQWVAPEQGCEYCHNTENLADDSKYTKVVARRMFQMTKRINTGWTQHVGTTGVTCYTCHRGNPVPRYIWFNQAAETRAVGLLGYRAGQNAPAMSVGLSSLPNDPFTDLLDNVQPIRVEATKALATPARAASTPQPGIKTAEKTYGLMIHMSTALGVNCTYCHNSRQFTDWSQSTPQRATAWYGIRMVRDLNMAYLDPLKPTWPANRLGALGDGPKAYCATCHQGLAKPLNGAQMHKDNLELDAAILN